MCKFFYCGTCQNDRSMNMYGGTVGAVKYCLKHIAGARARRTTEERAKRAIDNDAECTKTLTVKTSRATSVQEKEAIERRKKRDQRMLDREIALINANAFAI